MVTLPALRERFPVLMIVLLGTCAGLPVLAGCGDSAQPQPTLRASTTDQGGYLVSVTFVPDPAPLNEHFGLEVTVKDRNGAAPTAATIEVDADMPAHRHGINTQPTVRSTGAGSFQVEGILFHMGGDWELYVDVVAHGKRERATFPLTLR